MKKYVVCILSTVIASSIMLTGAFGALAGISGLDRGVAVEVENNATIIISKYAGRLCVTDGGKKTLVDKTVDVGESVNIGEVEEESYKATLQENNGELLVGELLVYRKSGNKYAALDLNQIAKPNARSTFSLIEFETEKNNTIKRANAIKGNTIFGKIDLRTDVDYFAMSFPSSGDFAVLLDEMPDGKDYDLTIFNLSGRQIASSSTASAVEFVKINGVVVGETYYAMVSGYNKSFDKTDTYRLQYSKFAYAADDHGNSVETATSVEDNSITSGSIDMVNDIDYFSFTASKSGEYKVFSQGNTDTFGMLYDSSKNLIAKNDDSGNWNFEIMESLIAGQTYYIAVKHVATGTGKYELNIETPEGGNSQQNAGNSFDTATKLDVTALSEAWFESANDARYFEFTPQESGSYTISSLGNIDTKAQLILADQETSLLLNDDGFDDKNFLLGRTLIAGEKYYIKVGPADGEASQGKFSIKVNKINAPSDPLFSSQWYLFNDGNAKDINIIPVWEKLSGKGVLIGVADTGTFYAHEDLSSNFINQLNYNFIHSMSEVFPENEKATSLSAKGGHGTHVTGIIGAAKNDVGIVGVAPQSLLVSLKVLGSELPDFPLENDIVASIKAIEYAQNNKIRIVNMSLGGSQSSESERIAMQNAGDVLFVVAAGNSSKDLSKSPIYPACYYLSNTIVVANSDRYGNKASTSNYGGPTDIAAPGSSINSTLPYNKYASNSGTSMATPVVAGLAALVLEKTPTLNPIQVKSRIVSAQNTNQEAGLNGYVHSGGIVDAFKAVLSGDVPRVTMFMDTNQREIMSLSVKDRIAHTKANADPNSYTEFIIAKFEAGVNERELIEKVKLENNFEVLEIVSEISMIDSFVVRCTNTKEASRAVDILNTYSEITYAEPDYIRDLHD